LRPFEFSRARPSSDILGAGMEPGYRILEHPADVGIQSWGATFPEALSMAVEGLAFVLLDPTMVEAVEQRMVSASADDSETLVVKVLSEVLYLFDGELFAPKSLQVHSYSRESVSASVHGEPLRAEKHRMRVDVKAVTYHQLSVQQGPGEFIITVYLDI